MNWTEARADEVRIEVDLIVGEPHSLAGQETKNNYLTLAQRGVEHWAARARAMRGAAGALLSRAQLAEQTHPDTADKFFQHARMLQRACEKGQVMADAVAASHDEVA